jgi:hypothetical protein
MVFIGEKKRLEKLNYARVAATLFFHVAASWVFR